VSLDLVKVVDKDELSECLLFTSERMSELLNPLFKGCFRRRGSF
jgi:hypothetical protein